MTFLIQGEGSKFEKKSGCFFSLKISSESFPDSKDIFNTWLRSFNASVTFFELMRL